MEPHEAPEKIYFGTQAVNPFYGLTRKCADDDIEYIRLDAFIDKAYFWLMNHYRDYMYNPTGERLEAFFGGDMCNDFEVYMKGE